MAGTNRAAPPGAQQPKLDKWSRLKLHLARRHDYFESEYRASNSSTDELQAAFFQAVFRTMLDFEMEEQRQAAARKT